MQRQALSKRLLTATYVFGVLGIALSITLLVLGMIAGGLTLLALTLLFLGWGAVAARMNKRNQM